MAPHVPPLLTERDTVDADGRFNRAVILRIALARARAERDLDVLLAAQGPSFRLPAGISQDNVAEWRRARAAAVDRTDLRLTPFHRLLAQELRRVWQAAHAARSRRAAIGRRRPAAPEGGGMIALAQARLVGLLKSDLATIEIELAIALAALERGDIAAVRRIVTDARSCALRGEAREADQPA